MKNEKIVTINGKKYDSATGLPVNPPSSSPKNISNKQPNTINNVHSLSQKVQALQHRAATRKPLATSESINRRIGRSMDVARSKSVAHFTQRPTAPQTPVKPVVAAKKTMDVGPVRHQMVKKIEQVRAVTKAATVQQAMTKSSKTIKEEAITEALNKPKPSEQQHKKGSFFKHKHSFINKVTVGILALIFIGFLTYACMPTVSVKIASASAGINATYPEYQPDGYRKDGLIIVDNNQVIIKFHANTGDTYFEIKQVKSSWDSSALKEKMTSEYNNEFLTKEQNGLTIYTHDGDAMWVNKGILYTIEGNAPLSSDQLTRIAASL